MFFLLFFLIINGENIIYDLSKGLIYANKKINEHIQIYYNITFIRQTKWRIEFRFAHAFLINNLLK